jgi:GT2 family glycosyltransferase
MARGHGYVEGATSIVIVCYDRWDMTEACLGSVLEAGDKFHEIVFVDNNSNDETPGMLRALRSDRFQTATLTQNVGYSRGANIGAGLAEGEYLVFLNNDTEVSPGWLDAQLTEMEPDVAAVAGTLVDPDGAIQHTGVDVYRNPILTASNTTHMRNAGDVECIAGTASLMRAYAYWQVGGHDPRFFCGYEDVDLCLRFRAHGWRLRYTPKSMVMHHKHQSGPMRWVHVQDNVRMLSELWPEVAR